MTAYDEFLSATQQPTLLPGDAAHHWSDAERRAILGAWACGRPLLICGEPGTGKTQLAHATAKILGIPCESEFIHARYEPSELLYRFDAVRRLAEAQVVAARYAPLLVQSSVDQLQARRQDMEAELAPEKFQEQGVLWKAMTADLPRDEQRNLRVETWPRAVVLIDEIDKADAEVPNRLLEVLGQRSFKPRFGALVSCNSHAPLVLITSNEERTLPAAFLRRCFLLRLAPDSSNRGDFVQWLQLRASVHSRLAALFRHAPGLAELAAQQVWEDRERVKEHATVGLAEYLDLLGSLVELSRGDWIQAERWLLELRPFVLRKHEGSSG